MEKVFHLWPEEACLASPAQLSSCKCLFQHIADEKLIAPSRKGERRSLSLLMFLRNKLCRTTVSVLITPHCATGPLWSEMEGKEYERRGKVFEDKNKGNSMNSH